MGLIYAAYAACGLATLLRCSPAWWRWLNAGGLALGRALAWLCSGGPGWKLARVQIERERRADRMAALLVQAAGWRREDARRLADQRARRERAPTGISTHLGGAGGSSSFGAVIAYGGQPPDRRTLLARQYDRQPRCDVCGQPRARCPRCRYFDQGLPSPVGCSGLRW